MLIILLNKLIAYHLFKPSICQIIYGIITNKTGAMGEILLFIAAEYATRITTEGYKVSVQKIGIAEL